MIVYKSNYDLVSLSVQRQINAGIFMLFSAAVVAFKYFSSDSIAKQQENSPKKKKKKPTDKTVKDHFKD